MGVSGETCPEEHICDASDEVRPEGHSSVASDEVLDEALNLPVSGEKKSHVEPTVGERVAPQSRSLGFRSAAKWAPNASNCAVCNAALGKRHLRARHHCRSCGKCVCANCSPHFISLCNMSGPQRACTLCAAAVAA